MIAMSILPPINWEKGREKRRDVPLLRRKPGKVARSAGWGVESKFGFCHVNTRVWCKPPGAGSSSHTPSGLRPPSPACAGEGGATSGRERRRLHGSVLFPKLRGCQGRAHSPSVTTGVLPDALWVRRLRRSQTLVRLVASEVLLTMRATARCVGVGRQLVTIHSLLKPCPVCQTLIAPSSSQEAEIGSRITENSMSLIRPIIKQPSL